jgi:hypothetical protein
MATLQCASGDVAADIAGGGDECDLHGTLQVKKIRNFDSYDYRQKKRKLRRWPVSP